MNSRIMFDQLMEMAQVLYISMRIMRSLIVSAFFKIILLREGYIYKMPAVCMFRGVRYLYNVQCLVACSIYTVIHTQ